MHADTYHALITPSSGCLMFWPLLQSVVYVSLMFLCITNHTYCMTKYMAVLALQQALIVIHTIKGLNNIKLFVARQDDKSILK